MRAIIARERAAGVDGLAPGEMPYPHAAENDVIVRVHAAGFTPGELDWPGTWTDRAGRDRTPTIPGHEVSGVVAELGYGTTGLTVGQRVFGVTDWCRNGTLAEFVAVEARNLAPLSAGVEHIMAAALPISGLTAWQGLFTHGQLAGWADRSDQRRRRRCRLASGAIGARGGRAGDRCRPRRQSARPSSGWERKASWTWIAIDSKSIGEVDMVFDVIGGQILCRSAILVRSGGAIVSIAEPPPGPPDNIRAVFFVVEPDRAGLVELERRLVDGRLRPLVGAIQPLEEAAVAFGPTHRGRGKTIIRVIDDVPEIIAEKAVS